MMADIQQTVMAAPRPGASRRAQNKRDMQSRAIAPVFPAPPAKRLKVLARRTKTAPSKPAGSDCSDASTHTSGGDSAELLAKAASCPPLVQGLAHKMSETNDAPGTPRILALPPAAAVPAASKSPPPETQPSPPRDATSGTPNAPESALAAATTDTAATGGSPSPLVCKSSSPEVTLVPAAPRLAPISAPMSLLNLQGSPPRTPTVVTPPPETPKMGRGRGRARGRGASVEPRAGGYQGRFCGRLFLKEDEAKLAAECQEVGPLLGCTLAEGGTEHDAGRHTLAKIVRAVASGAVRAHCSRREATIQELEAKLAAQQLAMRQSARRLTVENQAMRAQLSLFNKSIDALAAAQTLAPLPLASAPAAPPLPAAVSMPKPAVPLFSAPAPQQPRLFAGFPQFAGPPLPAMPLPQHQPPVPAPSFPAPLQPSPVFATLAALPAATTAMLKPAAAPPQMASLPMAAAFATHRRSAFAPVPRSPPSGGSGDGGRVMRPTPHVGVPPIALHPAGRA